jgi:biopolymer transport protein ExbD
MRRKLFRPVLLVTLLALHPLVSGCNVGFNSPAASTTRNLAIAKQDEYFTVYCVNKKVEVGSRSLSEMMDARGTNVCLHPDKEKSYPTLMEAQDAAAELGGVGVPCKCAR